MLSFHIFSKYQTNTSDKHTQVMIYFDASLIICNQVLYLF